MTDGVTGQHPDLEALDAFAAGRLDPAAAAALSRHAEACVLCRLELKRLRRFATIELDPDPEAAAAWPRMEAELEQAFHGRILPAIPGDRSGGRGSFRFRRRPVFWLLPAMAAAALLILVTRVDRPELETPSGRPPARGSARIDRRIQPLAPLGPLEAVPDRFVWKSTGAFESFTLEILTPELDPVLRRPGLTDSSWAVTDTLRAVLGRGGSFLWRVQGHRGLTTTETTVHGWFTIPPPPGSH
jgi:hypothetical protein